MRYLINLKYDGSKFYGYQIQDNNLTVEGEIERVLSTIFNEKINTMASSRTDKLVHANNQYCHFDSDKIIDANKLKYSVNRLINRSIYIKNICIVPDDFHSRFSVKIKEYLYKINMGEYNPIEKDYVLQYNKSISTKLLDEFISKMSGIHNYRSFTSDKDKKNYERDVSISYEIKDDLLILKFKSSGFLRYMIRNIVGLLLDINDNKKSINDIEYIFESKDRSACKRCASGLGLYLNNIIFKETSK